MYNPMSVAFDIPNPFAPRYEWGKSWWDRPALITVWHKDPEKDGTDSSCYHAYLYKKSNPCEDAIAEVMWDGETIFDNRPHYPDSKEHHWFQKLKKARLQSRLRRTRWRIHWRWHFWHWRFQVHPVLSLKRWLFSRCCVCGKRFPWGYSPCTGDWNASGPHWFRNEPDVMHHECSRQVVQHYSIQPGDQSCVQQ